MQHQEIQKQQQKAWHNRNIRYKNLLVGYLALLYNSRVKGKPKKLHTKWMGPYVVEEIHTNGSVRLKTLQALVFQKLVNGARLKRYKNWKKKSNNDLNHQPKPIKRQKNSKTK